MTGPARDRPILLAAGGTGGHLFPAEALARALAARGVAVELMTDDRALRYGVDFPARALHAVPSATPRNGSPLAKAAAAGQLSRGVLAAWRLLGTDAQGRDLLSAILYGLRISLQMGLVAGAVAFTLGAAIGTTAAYLGGRVESLLMRIVDLQLSFPAILLAFVLAALLGQGRWPLIAALVQVAREVAPTLEDRAGK